MIHNNVFRLQMLTFCIAIVLNLCGQKVVACDCVMYPVRSYIPASEFIFTVKVRQVHQESISYYKGYRATVEVVKVLKGQPLSGQELQFDAIDNSNCAFVFAANETHLLFAFKKDNKFYVYPCLYSGFRLN